MIESAVFVMLTVLLIVSGIVVAEIVRLSKATGKLLRDLDNIRTDIREIHAIINSRMSELVVSVGKAARAEGRAEGVAGDQHSIARLRQRLEELG